MRLDTGRTVVDVTGCGQRGARHGRPSPLSRSWCLPGPDSTMATMRNAIFLLALAALAATANVADAAIEICGDVNLSGNLSSTDALLVLKGAVGQQVPLGCPAIADLTTCSTNLSTANANLGTCNTNSGTCTANLSMASDGLEACRASL